MKKLTIFILFISLAASFAGCTSSKATKPSDAAIVTDDTAKTKIVTDASGAQVEIPTKINKIADSWKAHNEVLSVLGVGDKIVATSLTKGATPWFYKVTPTMDKAISTFGANFNTEDLMKDKPDVIFTQTSDASTSKMANLGIPEVQLNFTDFDSMKKCIALTGEVLGGEAQKRADEYNKYLDDKIKMIKDVTSSVPDNQKPKILHVESLSPIAVDGGNSIINDWIEAAGGINAAKEINGTMKQVSFEQVMAWNPDIIILGGDGSNGKVNQVQDMLNDSNWQKLAAVKNDKVYQNPAGAYLWDRYSAEEALQIQWAAKTIYPDKFNDLDIAAETKGFFKKFLNYDLTDDDVDKILKAQPPAAN